MDVPPAGYTSLENVIRSGRENSNGKSGKKINTGTKRTTGAAVYGQHHRKPQRKTNEQNLKIKIGIILLLIKVCSGKIFSCGPPPFDALVFAPERCFSVVLCVRLLTRKEFRLSLYTFW
jgi:hypothetical protein